MTDVVDRIVTGDAFDELTTLEGESVHAVVTDPPYGLAFMGRDWDDFEPEEFQKWCEEWASLALDALKPGGHLLVFGGNRTEHRMKTGVEDAGFEVRDTVTWHYGNGFPKNKKTLLKPATEFVVVARKPFSGTAADCYAEHGTAYLNVDDARIEAGERPERTQEDASPDRSALNSAEDGSLQSSGKASGTTSEGRYPANAVFDEEAAEELDADVGELGGGSAGEVHHSAGPHNESVYGDASENGWVTETYGDRGGASRYFYTSKATRSERTLNGQIENGHPTVKPLDLMEWLVTLVSRADQLVVDPFCGSGTTCRAAKDLGRRFIGIEENPRWADVARVRCGLSPVDPSRVRRDDDSQSGLETFVPDDGETPDPSSTGVDR